ncbi:MAG: hypothetical protein K0Q55_3637 [Verrucomicrobia bacterium]|jgi:hypothetical protein|nr:hypothetical protein [Verrucomicrobiota bacterium]
MDTTESKFASSETRIFPGGRFSYFAFVISLVSLAGIQAVAQVSSAKTETTKPAGAYVLRAGGPHSVVQITNAPASNPVSITYVPSPSPTATFRLTNREPQSIMIWNVRVQVKAQDGGTDGQGWKTVHDDYPTGNKLARIPTGGVDQVTVSRPGDEPWRVCVLYSKETVVTNPRRYTGNFEVISQELKE